MESFKRRRLIRRILVAFPMCYLAWIVMMLFWPNETMRAGRDSNIFLPKGVDKYPAFVDGHFMPVNRIFHVDLKGAPPRMRYWEELIPFIRAIGATGILLEYEDMFPYSGRLERLRSANAYTREEILHILTLSRNNNLEIIPLVQTLGHLEWILKYKQFAEYRESEKYPQVICLGDEEAVKLVLETLVQVIRMHKDFDLNFFHIGGDEAFQIGECSNDRTLMMKMKWDRKQLMINHFVRIAKYLKAKLNGLRILMWHDMLVDVPQQTTRQFELSSLVEPVVWQYAENLHTYVDRELWSSLASNFPYIWAASAFKGADGPSQYILNLPHYVKNHMSWMNQMDNIYKQFVQFRGIFVTGWQRFDHFAVLCELLPVGLVSATFNFAILKNGLTTVIKEAERVLNCSLGSLDIFTDQNSAFINCAFPGSNVYYAIVRLSDTLKAVEEDVFNDYRVRGWLSEFNDRFEYTQVWYLDAIKGKVLNHIDALMLTTSSLKKEMLMIFFEDTVEEFVFEYVGPTLHRLQQLQQRIGKLSKLREFPRRPFRITSNLTMVEEAILERRRRLFNMMNGDI